MKNSHVCPKCASTDIVRVDGSCGAYGVDLEDIKKFGKGTNGKSREYILNKY